MKSGELKILEIDLTGITTPQEQNKSKKWRSGRLMTYSKKDLGSWRKYYGKMKWSGSTFTQTAKEPNGRMHGRKPS